MADNNQEFSILQQAHDSIPFCVSQQSDGSLKSTHLYWSNFCEILPWQAQTDVFNSM